MKIFRHRKKILFGCLIALVALLLTIFICDSIIDHQPKYLGEKILIP